MKLEKILIINIFGIGDVLFTTPLIENLKNFNSQMSIGYLCNRRAEPVLRTNPKIDKIFLYERDEFVAYAKKSKILYWKKIKDLIDEIRKEQYDTVLDVSMNGLTGFLSWAAGIKKRVGLNYKNRNPFLNRKIVFKGYEERHVVEYYLDLLRTLEIPITSNELKLYLESGDEAWVDQFLKNKGLNPSLPLMGIVPGGGASWGKEALYKRWPAESYSKLADKMVEKFNAQIILMGASEEKELCLTVAGGMKKPPVFACGETTISRFAALARRCRVNIVNDGGPLHVAVAVGAKTVSIFGPVDEKVYGPYPHGNHQVVTKNLACRPCYRNFRRAACEHISCLKDISVEDVFNTVNEVMS